VAERSFEDVAAFDAPVSAYRRRGKVPQAEIRNERMERAASGPNICRS